MRSLSLMQKSISKEEILRDFADVINHIDDKPADEIETHLRKIIYKIRPLIHHV